ncbi:leucine Rich repeat-containing domain protein [Opisthorchis viverrini]|uniref:Leucine Rich repeat-containing domain protein n=1 Tax=Opisthorchis viverrini TaxID=6198 RepID=A0A1S8WI70_OPIVI|nr:leucine Rich repeat-containing domain protein [Opisthorchis viverrini]
MTFMTLPQRIELEQGKKAPSEIKELTLSHSKSTVIEGLSDEFTNLEVLNLVGVGLEDLSGLPKLPSLKILDLSNNAISGGLEALLNCPNLETLNLSANKVATIDTLLPLAKLSCLSSIDLFNCEVTGLENYRKTVFAALPNLKYLDGLDENNEEEPTGAVPNGDVEEANGEEKADDDEEKDSDDDEEEEEEYGIEALQRSGDLEDDDEDYAPGHFGQSPLWARELCLNILVPDHEPLHRVIWCPPKANQELTRLTDTGMEFGPKSMLRRAHFNPNRAAMHAHFSFHSQMGFFCKPRTCGVSVVSVTLICVLHLASSSVVGHEQLALWCPSLTTTFKQQLCFVDLGEEEDAELGVTGPRRPGSKRRRSDLAPVADDDLDDEAPVIKHKASEETEGHINNGATLE